MASRFILIIEVLVLLVLVGWAAPFDSVFSTPAGRGARALSRSEFALAAEQFVDPSWRGVGTSTPSQTAWALLALLDGRGSRVAVERAVGWLVRNQREDGDWDEEHFTGTGFPGDFYIRYHQYRLNFPVMALGRYLRGGAS